MHCARYSKPLHFWLAVMALLCLAFGANAQVISLRTNGRTALLANGKDGIDLIAEVRDPSGRPVGNNVVVQFQTSMGTLTALQVPAFGGVARTRLTSTVIGTARISAFAPGYGVSQPIEIIFTDEAEAIFGGNSYINIVGNSYLAYSTTDRVIDAQGKNGGAKITYRNIEVTANRIQLRCEDNLLRAAGGVRLKRGKVELKAERLYYSLQSGQGYILAERDGHQQIYYLSGENLIEQPSAPIPNSYLLFPELQVKLMVVARGITYFPGDRLQFRRPRFFQDQTQILSLPFYELPLNSTELFSDQFISVGTNGLGLELPIYYGLSPRKTGIVYLRHQQQLGRGYFANNPGWSVDVVQGYSQQGGDSRYEGAFGLIGMTRGDWGLRWTHNHEFNQSSQATMYLDFPQHNSVYSSLTYNQQSKKFRWGSNLSAGQTFLAPVDSSIRSDFYGESQPRHLLNSKNFLYTLGANVSTVNTRSSNVDFGNYNETTRSVTMRAFSRPMRLDTRTSLTSSFSMGNQWTSLGRNGFNGLASMAMDHTIPGGGNIGATYDLVVQPAGQFISSGNHRVGLTYNIVLNKKMQASFFGSAFLDAPDASFLADVSYRIDNDWRVLSAVTLQRFSSQKFQDIQLTIGRRIGARELQLTYSTFNKRVSLDLTATRF